MRRAPWMVLLFSFLVSAASASDAPSQPTELVIHGTVVDSSQAPIPGALVTATLDGDPGPVSATTDARGEFSLPLKSGQYSVRVHVDGFRDVEQRLAAGPASAVPARFVLQVAGVREAVTVTAARGYQVPVITSATKTPTALLDVPQSVTVVTSELIKDQMMMSVGDVMRYVPGVMVHQGENNRDQVIIRGNSSSADFFVDGVRDDVQYYRDLYNLERVETLKGPNAMIFGRGGAGGVVNRVSREAGFRASREVSLQAGMFGNRRLTAGFNEPVNEKVALRLDGMFENSDSFRNFVGLERYGITPTATITAGPDTKVTLRYEFLKDTRTADRGITSFQGAPAAVAPDTFYGNPDLSDVRAQVNVASGLVEHRAGRITIRNRTVAANYDRFYQNFVPGAATANQSLVALTTYNNATDRTNVFNQTDVSATSD